jgi:hypothetical protein
LFIFIIQTVQADEIQKNNIARLPVLTYGKIGNSLPSYAVVTIDTSVNPIALEASFFEIKKTLNSNVSIIGVSTNVASTIEQAYQIKDHVSYFIACQEPKDKSGWNYEQFVNAPATNPNNYDQTTFACKLVQSYGEYYRHQEEGFALSAIDLNKISKVVNNINDFIQAVKECEKFDPATIKNTIKNAAQNALSFNVMDYIDLNSFYTNVLSQMSKITTDNVHYEKARQDLLVIINVGKMLIQSSVFSRVCGGNISGACGLSIYYPQSTAVIRESYLETKFEKETCWLNFITQYR